jgi:hypothetical protein
MRRRPRVSIAPPCRRRQQVALPFNPPIALLRQARAGASGAAQQAVRTSWLRVTVDGMPLQARHLALYGVRVKTDGTIAVYINGQLTHQAQQNGPSWNSTRTPLWFTLDNSPGSPPVREILLRLEHSSASQTAVSSLRLGPAEVLRPAYHLRGTAAVAGGSAPPSWRWAFAASSGCAAGMRLRTCCSSIYRRRHFCAACISRRSARGKRLVAWLTVNSLFWLVLAVHFFLCQLHQRPAGAGSRARWSR